MIYFFAQSCSFDIFLNYSLTLFPYSFLVGNWSHFLGFRFVVVSLQRLQQQRALVWQYTYCVGVETPGERQARVGAVLYHNGRIWRPPPPLAPLIELLLLLHYRNNYRRQCSLLCSIPPRYKRRSSARSPSCDVCSWGPGPICCRRRRYPCNTREYPKSSVFGLKTSFDEWIENNISQQVSDILVPFQFVSIERINSFHFV